MIDSHAHVVAEQFDEDRGEVFVRAKEAGVTGWIEIGTDLEQSRKAVALAEQYENVWATVGVHPDDIGSLDEAMWDELELLLAHEKVKAIGEVGLDLYRTSPGFPAAGRGGDLEAQKEVLTRFIGLAQAHSLPLVFHVRSGEDIDLHDELIALLRQSHLRGGIGGGAGKGLQGLHGVLHTFSGNVEQALQYVELGMYISFSGVVTFKNALETQEVAKAVPMDKILIETDCPFLAPDPYRGQRNEPAYVALVADKLAVLRGVSVEEVQRQTQDNTKRLFAL